MIPDTTKLRGTRPLQCRASARRRVRCSGELAGQPLGLVNLPVDCWPKKAKDEAKHDEHREEVPIFASDVNFREATPPIFRCRFASARCGTNRGIEVVTDLMVERLGQQQIGHSATQQKYAR